jgi:hypothetical protein
MHPLVRDLYKRFVQVGAHYPQGLDFVRAKARKGFLENAHLHSEVEIKKAVGKGRYWAREIEAISRLHKYRTLRKRYSS